MVCNIFIIAGEGVKQAAPSVSLNKAIAETIAAKKNSGRRPRYIKSLELYLKQFARGREEMPVGDFGVEEVEAWFADRREAPVTRASNLGRLSAMFSVCERRGYIDENPIERIDKPFVDYKAPKIFTLRQTAKALLFAKRRHPDFLAWLTLSLLAGLRPEEADKIRWSHIDLERGEVRIGADVSKVRARRIVHLTPGALAWMRYAKQRDSILPLSHSTRRRRLRALRDFLRFDNWPQDILRHTAASYLIANFGNAGMVATELGNSASILARHYKELVTKEQGTVFANLRPSWRMLNTANGL